MLLLQHLLRRAPAAAVHGPHRIVYASEGATSTAAVRRRSRTRRTTTNSRARAATRSRIPNRYDSIVIGCGVSGTAAVEAVAKHADRGHRCLVLESDAFAVRRCEAFSAEVGSDIIDCVRARAESLNPLLRQVRTTHGDEYSYAKKCLVATGAAAAVPPPGFVDELCVESVRCLGHGEAADAAAVCGTPFRSRKRGGRVCVVGGSWQAVALAAAVARAAPAETAGESASLVFSRGDAHRCSFTEGPGQEAPETSRKRGVTVIALHQIRYVGPNEDNRKASHAVYLARADDAMKTSRCSADFGGCGGRRTRAAGPSVGARRAFCPSRFHGSGSGQSDETRRRHATAAHLRQRGAEQERQY